jgi:hypothetical protein
MRDKQICKSEVALQSCEKVDDLGTDADIKGRDWFVADNKLWPQCECTSYDDALPLAAAKLVGVTLHRGRVEANRKKKIRDSGSKIVFSVFCGFAGLRSPLLMNYQWFGKQILHPHARIKRAERVLKDDLHISSMAPKFASARGQQVASVKTNYAESWFDQSQDKTAQSAFAGARLANQTQGFAGLNVERNIVYGPGFAPMAGSKEAFGGDEDLRDVSYLDQGHDWIVAETLLAFLNHL